MIEIVKSKSNLEVKKINGFFTHSIYDPKKEAKKFFEKHFEDVHIHIIYGYGSGYIIEEFLKNNIFKTLYIVLDPFIDITKMKDSKLVKYIYLKEIEDIKNIFPLLSNISKNIKISTSPNYDRMDPIFYEKILREIKTHLELVKVNENTVVSFSHLWFRNYLTNIKYADSSVIHLQQKSKKGVVVVSGGPSLTKQLSLLKKYSNEFLIISAGSATNSLIQAEIIPDVVVSIDGHSLNYKHFENLYLDKTIYVYSMYSYPDIRKHFKEGYYFLDGTGRSLISSLHNITGDEVVILPGGGSVAHYALSLALYITQGPICLIGQDLAYLDGQTHAINNILGKTLTLEEQKKLKLIDGYYGKQVYSDTAFISMKKTFEDMATSIGPTRKIFNCTEGGALIEGIPNLEFNNFCEKYKCIEKEVLHRDSDKHQKLDPKKIYKEILLKYETIYKVATSNLKLVEKSKKKKIFSEKILKEMKRNDEKLTKLSEDDIVNIAFQTININIQKRFKKELNEALDQSFNNAIEENFFMYEEIREMVELGIKTVKSNLIELEKIE